MASPWGLLIPILDYSYNSVLLFFFLTVSVTQRKYSLNVTTCFACLNLAVSYLAEEKFNVNYVFPVCLSFITNKLAINRSLCLAGGSSYLFCFCLTALVLLLL